jgi:hypothetical protein
MEQRKLLLVDEDTIRDINPLKIVFLDIDGVLNGYNKWTWRLCSIIDFLHLRVWFNRHYDIFGIRPYKVYLLSKIIRKTNSKVVISSSWRAGFLVDNIKDSRLYKLKKYLKKYDIEVIGITPRAKDGCPSNLIRETEIRTFLKMINDINKVTSYVVLDDESFDLQGFVGHHLVQTGEVSETIMGRPKEDTGLKRKHVKRAIEILNMG